MEEKKRKLEEVENEIESSKKLKTNLNDDKNNDTKNDKLKEYNLIFHFLETFFGKNSIGLPF